jgi:hypothetical protein
MNMFKTLTDGVEKVTTTVQDQNLTESQDNLIAFLSKQKEVIATGITSNNSNTAGKKRKALPKKEQRTKKKFAGLRLITVEEFVFEVGAILSETGKPTKSTDELTTIYHKYEHVPTTPAREWSAAENRLLANMFIELGFEGIETVELNQMLPEGTTMRDGSPVEEANVLVTRQLGQQLGIDMDLLYDQLEAHKMDKLKWSRRAKSIDKNGNPTNGQQNKIARHNCCITDAEEDGEVIEHGVRAGHPKNMDIKFTFYSYETFLELKKFRWRCAAILGPFGYKIYDQYHELNKYYDKQRGIGRHGDIERGPEDHPSCGMVNCLKVGFHIPILFSWYYSAKPAGRSDAIGSTCVSKVSFPVVPMVKKVGGIVKWSTSTVAAVFTLGHGDYYQMSGKAIGKDWNKYDWALRHCAGHKKYTGLPRTYYDAVEATFGTVKPVAYSLTGSDRVENDSETPELQSATRFDGH